jgi:hypothetical protein
MGSLLSQGIGFASNAPPLDPHYQTPRSFEMNIGVQREVQRGMIFSADFVRNVQTHYFLAIDENHTGDVRYFDKVAAQQAVAATLSFWGAALSTGRSSCVRPIQTGQTKADIHREQPPWQISH